MPKKEKNTYEVEGKKYPSFASAAGAAVDLALHRGEAVAISEINPAGTLVGYVHVEASGEVV